MKKKVIMVISLPRSGTNHFFDKIQKIETTNVISYYELFNDSFYGKSQCWDNFYDKYQCKNKVEVFKKIINNGNGLHERLIQECINHENRINVIKIFPNQITKKEFIQMITIQEYDINFLFLLRDIKEVHQSYYHALTKNDWTRCRKEKLQQYDLITMLENNHFRHIYENKIFECYLHDMLQIIINYKKKYKLLNFKKYKDYQIDDLEKIINV